MSRFRDLTNKRFGRLFVVALARVVPEKDYRVYWRCWCDCGAEKDIRSDGLTSGLAQSCGCLQKEVSAQFKGTGSPTYKHGGKGCREYRSWSGMKSRCFDRNHPRYQDWGGRGITVCARWRDDFAAFLADMGPCPTGHSIDRINNDGDYEPGNCRWADAITQRNNRRDSKRASA
jgi:hypothetical protein